MSLSGDPPFRGGSCSVAEWGGTETARLGHPQLARGCLSEVVVDPTGVRPSIDDGHDDCVPVVTKRHFRAAGQSLVGDPERVMRERGAAGGLMAEEAGAVPRGPYRPVIRGRGLRLRVVLRVRRSAAGARPCGRCGGGRPRCPRRGGRGGGGGGAPAPLLC